MEHAVFQTQCHGTPSASFIEAIPCAKAIFIGRVIVIATRPLLKQPTMGLIDPLQTQLPI
jgi:hypothetical protein